MYVVTHSAATVYKRVFSPSSFPLSRFYSPTHLLIHSFTVIIRLYSPTHPLELTHSSTLLTHSSTCSHPLIHLYSPTLPLVLTHLYSPTHPLVVIHLSSCTHRLIHLYSPSASIFFHHPKASALTFNLLSMCNIGDICQCWFL